MGTTVDPTSRRANPRFRVGIVCGVDDYDLNEKITRPGDRRNPEEQRVIP